MSELKISIGSIKYDLSCQENEKEIIIEVVRRINQKMNLLSLEIGRINEKILLSILLIITAKKTEKIKNEKFDDTLINILKIISPLLNTKTDSELEEKLIVSNIIKESELMNMSDDNTEETVTDNNESSFDKETYYKEMSCLIDNLSLIIKNLKA
jgi:cell division protein ZapA (FtsZ GTPase activity inhibitor)